MYNAIKMVLRDWQVYRWQRNEEDYFLVTAIKGSSSGMGECRVVRFPGHTRQGRHLLIVQRGPWTFINVHGESGPTAGDRDARNCQLIRMSRLDELDQNHVRVLAGDFNMRDGEEKSLCSEGWVDAWQTPGAERRGDEWTWRRGDSSARFDRVYVHSNMLKQLICERTRRLDQVWSVLTDHVALHTVLQLATDSSTDNPSMVSIGAGSCLATGHSTSHSIDARDGSTSQCGGSTSSQSRFFHREDAPEGIARPVRQDSSANEPSSSATQSSQRLAQPSPSKVDVPVVAIANNVTRAMQRITV